MALQAKKLLVTWECKDCHQRITDSETVAYHLICGMLYGWCESCFSKSRNPVE